MTDDTTSARANPTGLRRGTWIGATLLATGVVIAVLIRNLGGRDFADAVRGARLAWVGLAFGLASVCVLLGALRWQLVLRAMGYGLGFGRLLVVILATWPPGVIVPSRANEVLRAVAIRSSVPLAEGTGSIVAEKLIDLFVLLVFAGVGAGLRGMWALTAIVGSAAGLQVAALAFLGTRRSWVAGLPLLRARPGTTQRLFAASDVLARRRGPLLVVSLVSLAIRVLTVGVGHALLVAVGSGVRLFDTLTLWPVAILVGILPVTLGGMGTRDAAFIYLLRSVGVQAAGASVLAATMGYSAVALWSFALVGVPFMVREAVGESGAPKAHTGTRS